MKKIFLIVGLTMMLNINAGIGSALLSDDENTKLEKNIFNKLNQNGLSVKSLENSEKEWLYETNLLKALEAYNDIDDSEDVSRYLGELASFYDYKQSLKLAKETFLKKAQFDIKDALKSYSLVGRFDSLVEKGLLNSDFIESLNVHLKKEYGPQDSELIELAEELADSYRKLNQRTIELRIKRNIPAIPMYDDVLEMSLKESKGTS